jgi:RNA polymerase sigma-70 factor (ECF subfamily)
MGMESEAVERAAAEFIQDRHRLSAFVGGLVRDPHTVEDLIQEVWIRLAAEARKGTQLENQAAWCRGVARNLIRRHWEQQKSSKVVADSSVLEAFLERVELAFAESDTEPAVWAERQSALNECVAALPERSRRILELRYEARASMSAVASAMGQSFEGTTKTLYRVRRALLECVNKKLSLI